MSDCIFCKKTFSCKSNLDRHLSTNTCKSKIFNSQLDVYKQITKEVKLQVEQVLQQLPIESPVKLPIELPVETQLAIIPNTLIFDGEFAGREHEIRITPDKMISVIDFIRVVGGQKKPQNVWYDIKKKYKNELGTFCSQYKFPGQGKTTGPVINVQGMVKLLFLLPGDLAKQFRSKSAEVMIRYLGGDLTLIDEIKAIDQVHINNPNNNLQVFREEVKTQLLLNFDQMNHSSHLLLYFGGKTYIFYTLLVLYDGKWYIKFGIVHIRDFFDRFKEHVTANIFLLNT